MKKKLLSLILAMSILMPGVSLIAPSAHADREYTDKNGIVYSIDEEHNKASVIGYNGDATSVDIPSSFRTPDDLHCNVDRIAAEAFAGHTGLTSIEIPDSILMIGMDAFDGCSALATIKVPCYFNKSKFNHSGVIVNESSYSINNTDLNHGTFELIHNYEETIIREPTDDQMGIVEHRCTHCEDTYYTNIINTRNDGIVYRIGEERYEASVIDYNGDATSVDIPSSVNYDNTLYAVTSIGGSAFAGCKELKSITIPEGVTSIGGSAFAGCKELKSITIPEGVTSIGDYAFANCEELKSITIPNSVTNIGTCAFIGCSTLSTIKIPCNFDKSKFSKNDSWIFVNHDETGYSIALASVAGHPFDVRDIGTFELIHDYQETIIKQPTDDQVGIVEHRCTHCEDSYRTNIIKEGSNPSLMPDGSKISDSAQKAEAEVEIAGGETITTALQDPLGVLGDNVTLESTLVEDEESVENCYKLIETLEGQGTIKNVQILEMVPYVGGDKIHGQLNGMVRLMFKVPNGWDKNNTKVVLIDPDADISDEDRIFDSEIETIDGEDYIVIYTDHFSQYALVEMATDEDQAATSEVSDTSNTSSVKTGDNAPILALSILISVCALAIVMIERKNSQNI